MGSKRTGWLAIAGLVGAIGVFVWSGCGNGSPMPTLKDSYGDFEGKRAFVHTKAMIAFGPRPAGSDALKQNADYIGEELAKLGLEMEVQEFQSEHPEAKGVKFRNLWCDVPGEDPANGPIILVTAHYDTKMTAGHPEPEQNFRFVGAMDGAGPSAILLELARILAAEPRTPTIRLVWFDGEESIPYVWKDELALFGSTRYADWLSETKQLARVKVMILLDLLGSKNLKIDRDHKSNRKLNDLFGEVANDMGESERMYRFISLMTDDHLPFQRKGLKVIDLIDFRYRSPNDRRWHGDKGKPPADGEFTAWWHTPADNLENMDPRSLDFCGNLVLRALPKIFDKFYR